MRRPDGLTVVSSICRQAVLATDTETASSLLWFATIRCIESKQDLAGLAPEDGFIPAEPVERVTRQVGESQEATREVGRRIDGRFDRLRPGTGHGFGCVRDAAWCRILVATDPSTTKYRVDNSSSGRVNLPGRPESIQLVSLNFEQGGFLLSWRDAAATTDWLTAASVLALRLIEHHDPP
jgi:hypothetical protein